MSENRKNLKITADGESRLYPQGVSYRDIAADFQKYHDSEILLVSRGGKLCELHKKPRGDCELRMLTFRDKPGYQTYERSAVFLLLKAFYDTAGEKNVQRISVEFSLSHALFIRASGSFTLDQALLDRVKSRMKELTAAAAPITKSSMSTEDAIDLFNRSGMYDKARLLRFRISSRVNLYTLDGFCDYFYGYMLPDAGYLKNFDLRLFEEGFVLLLPEQNKPDRLCEFAPSMKVFRELYNATLKSEKLGVANVGQLNEMISRGHTGDMILAQEAMMEKKIGDIAEEIANRSGVRFVMIAGPSSSGKTTFSHRLSTQLTACGMRPHAIATDNYFKNRDDTPKDASGQYDFETLEAMDVKKFNEDMTKLFSGETVEIPHFNFKKGVREYTGDYLTMGPADVLVIEGIHCLDDRLSYSLPKDCKYRIYISCLTTLNIDEHNRIPTTDARLLRRIARDAGTRGSSAANTIKMWPSVRKGEEDNIFPFQDSADVVFNSALTYENALLKPYVEPLLFDVPQGSDEYIEAKRLLKFLSYFLTVPSDDVPKTSIMREFIGGGCYNV